MSEKIVPFLTASLITFVPTVLGRLEVPAVSMRVYPIL